MEKENARIYIPEVKKMKYSLGTHLSFSMGGFLDNFTTTAFGIRTYAFYNLVLLLPSWMVALAFTLYAGWNMINDPLVGYFSDLHHKYIAKWGRRFPLIIIGMVPYAFSYLLIYTVAFQSEWLIFAWLLFSICFFDFCYSIWQLNYLALLPVKFTNHYERTRVGGINTILGIFGVVCGMLLPPMLIGDYDVQENYVSAAVIISLITLIAGVLMIPGIRENKQLREQTLARLKLEKESQEKFSFFKVLLMCLKRRNFMMYIGLTLAHAVMTTLMLGSLQYWVQFVLISDDPDYETFVGAALLIGVLISVPLWTKVSRKKGNRIAYIIGGFGSSATLLLFFLLATEIVMGIILTLLIGIFIGAFWTLMYPGLSDVIDELKASSLFQNEGVYTGIRTFFSRFAFVIQSVAMAGIHTLTGFNENNTIQTSRAQTGIMVHMALIPMIFYLIGTLLILFWYDLTPEKLQTIKAKLTT
ncbi:MAG: MFS transporter [Promethearchaeota archaeon]